METILHVSRNGVISNILISRQVYDSIRAIFV
jgi:hypothetical protein